MFDRLTVDTNRKQSRFESCTAAQRARLKKGLRTLLASSECREAALLELLEGASIRSERLLSALPRLTERTLRGLTRTHRLSEADAAERRENLQAVAFERLAEAASPLHALLCGTPIYRDSDPPTRRLLRVQIERFAKRHRLSLGQAAALWQASPQKPAVRGLHLLRKCTQWMPFLLALLTALSLLVWMGKRWFFGGAFPIALALFCPIWEGYARLWEAGVRLLLPSAAEPALCKEKAPPVCAMLIVSASEGADSALRSLEMLIAANRDARGCFGLILTLPDASAHGTLEDERLCKPFAEAFAKLEARCNRPLCLCIAKRRYLPRGRVWRGTLTHAELLDACTRLLKGDPNAFGRVLGTKMPLSSSSLTPAALYLAPSNACLSPDGLRSLAAVLFHPLNTADCVLPLLRASDPDQRERAEVGLKRAVTLQKLGCTLPFSGYGMIRLSALTEEERGFAPTLPEGTLAPTALFTDRAPAPSEAARQDNTLVLEILPRFRHIAASLLRLPLFLCLMQAPPALFGCGLALCHADLAAELLLSVRFGRRFATHTLPAAYSTAGRVLSRAVFPVQNCFSALPNTNRLSEKAARCLKSGAAIAIGLAAALFGDFPFSAAGLVWSLSPALSAEFKRRHKLRLPERDRADLLEWNRKSLTLFEQKLPFPQALPPTVWLERPCLHSSDCTSPTAFSFYLIACLSACDLGLIDAFTLERRVAASLDAWEKLPSFHGLPYARYSLETEDSCGDTALTTASCGLFALSMALLSEGLRDHAPQNPALEGLSSRAEGLWRRMDFTRLYDRERALFCEALLPSGKPFGQLDLLMSGAKSAVIAALALGQIDRSAWKKLKRPAAGRSLLPGMQSEYGALEDYLLDALFLPASPRSLIGRARRHACSVNRTLCSSAYSLTDGGLPSEIPLPSGHPSLARLQTGVSDARMPPHAAFLMLPFSPRRAMKCLRDFRADGALGAYGFYEAIDRTQNGERRVVRLWATEHLGQSIAATANLLKEGIHSKRLMRIPAFAALTPLLNEPYDWLAPSLEPIHSARNEKQSDGASASQILPVCLLGDAEWGVLWADGMRMLPYYKRKPMAYFAPPDDLFGDGHFSGLLLFKDRRPISAQVTLFHRDERSITLAYRADGCSVLATLSFPKSGLLELKLSSDAIDQQIDALFCFTPPPSEKAFRLETRPSDNLLLVRAAGYSAALAAEGFDKCFIRADEAPLPLGADALASLIDREGTFTESSLLTPACRLGGRPGGQAEGVFRMAFGRNAQEAIQTLGQTAEAPPLDLHLLPKEAEGALSCATAIELRCLLEHGCLRPIRPSPTAQCSANLLRVLEESAATLEQRGFVKCGTPFFLPENNSLSADERLKSCLYSRADRLPALTSPPLPARTRIKLTEQTVTVQKGRDLPPIARAYAGGQCVFWADSYTPSFCFEGSEQAVALTLTLPEANRQRERSLFYGAREVCYAEESVRYIGEGYSVTVTLSAAERLLTVEVNAPLPADIRLGLPPCSVHTEESDFWHRDGATTDFCSKIVGERKTVFWLGSFKRTDDRRFYLIREKITDRLAAHLPPIEPAEPSNLLVWQSRPPYPTPLLVHLPLASDDPSVFPMLLFFREEAALEALLRLFSTDSRPMQVIACLLWAECTENLDALRQKICHPSASGSVEESVYLSAARALESMLEADSSRFSPLLPRLTASFADLARRMGDFSGEAYYRSLSLPPARLPARTDTFESIAAYLSAGDLRGTAALKRRIDALPLFPSPEEASALWSLFWYGALGYRESPNAFTLRPLLSADFGELAFQLRKKDTLYRIRIIPSDRTCFLLDGSENGGPFLFDKKEHFLEITVEKSAQIV